MQQTTVSTTYTGTSLTSATIQASLTGSVIGAKDTSMTINSVGLIVYYTGTAPPMNTSILVAPPLSYNSDTLVLTLNEPIDTGLDTGAANAYAVSVSGLTLNPGATVKFLAAHASTSATPTFNLNGYGAKTILGPSGLPLAAGDIGTTAAVILNYSNGNWYLQNPQSMQPTTGAGPSQTVVTSASTIAPTARFFLVSGSAAISTITAPAFCVVTGTMCQITMIPASGSTWTTTTGGNIALGSTAVPFKALVMTYDPSGSLWYPSY